MTTAAAAAAAVQLNKNSVLAAGNLARETKFQAVETRFCPFAIMPLDFEFVFFLFSLFLEKLCHKKIRLCYFQLNYAT